MLVFSTKKYFFGGHTHKTISFNYNLVYFKAFYLTFLFNLQNKRFKPIKPVFLRIGSGFLFKTRMTTSISSEAQKLLNDIWKKMIYRVCHIYRILTLLIPKNFSRLS